MKNNEYKQHAQQKAALFKEVKMKQRLAKKLQDKPYWVKYAWQRIGVFSLSVVANLWNFLTTFVSIVFMASFLPYPMITAPIVGVFIAGIIELLKRGTLSNLFDRTDRFNWVNLAAAITATAVTLAISLAYVTKVPKVMTDEPAPVAVDATAAEAINERLKANKAAQAQEAKRTWKGVLTQSASKRLEELRAQEWVLHSEMKALGSAATAKTEAKLKDYNKKMEEVEFTLFYATILAELILWFCIAYLEYYDYKSILEDPDLCPDPIGPGKKKPKQIPTNSNHGAPPSEGGASTGGPAPFSVITGGNSLEQLGELLAALGKESKFTVSHKKEDGQTVQYTAADLRRYLSIYEGRAKESAQAFAEAPELSEKKEAAKKVLESRLKKLKYWMGKSKELVSKIERA